MYSNFSALNTNMAIYLSPFQRHYPPHGYVIIYAAQNIYSSGKINNIPPPPPPKPRLYKALAVNGAQR